MTSENDTERKGARFRLSQETIAIVTVGIALAGLNLATVDDLREEARADRAAWQTESRQLRDEARADREDFQRQMEALQRQMVGLSVEQAKLAAAIAPKE